MQHLQSEEKIKISGFNNLTKCLSFNIYDFVVARTEAERRSYIKYVQENYSATKITEALKGICEIIEANVLAISDQDYVPWGASSMVLMSDIKGAAAASSAAMHLDKSHICAHTYPDIIEESDVCSLRLDIDIATCGEISPLNALNFMFEKFENDVVVIDYVVRGFARDQQGKRIYMDHPLGSIQEYISGATLENYYCQDLTLQSDHIWQTKMLRTKLDEQDYFVEKTDTHSSEAQKALSLLSKKKCARYCICGQSNWPLRFPVEITLRIIIGVKPHE